MTIPSDYTERVYAGVLGKMIGVYLGRPFEGSSYERIMADLGEIDHYVHAQCGVPLIVTDDDLSGTFTFVRALQDHANGPALTAEQIGQSWLNYVLEDRTIFWWGGMGNSTEHTAFLRLKHGIPAPLSGSIATNGKVVAEQIGAQIFIDGWAMVAPGDPALAAELARRAASVSHDGEAIYGAQVIAAMEAEAFVNPEINHLIDTALRFIPSDSVIARMIGDLRAWHAGEPDWRKTREKIVERYGYAKYGGGCHMIPNHALILLGLLYGGDDFSKALMITNTCGWDTDCNSGNIGCLMGIRVGLAGIDASPYDWRGPVADRLLLPTADGGSAITDAVRESLRIVNMGRALAGEAPLLPKQGARFHFELPGSVQSFEAAAEPDCMPDVQVKNVSGFSQTGARSLEISFHASVPNTCVRVSTPTFVTPQDAKMPGYSLYASPTLYPGQTIRAGVSAGPNHLQSIVVRFYLDCYNGDDQPERVYGDIQEFAPQSVHTITWRVPDLGGKPIFAVGLEVRVQQATLVQIYLDYLTWDGAPEMTFQSLPGSGSLWRSAWVNGVDHLERWGAAFRPIQNEGRGLLSTGADWSDYQVSALVKIAMAKSAGIAARVQGMRRFYGLLLTQTGTLRLIKAMEGGDRLLGEIPCPWALWSQHTFTLQVRGNHICASLDNRNVFDVSDDDAPLLKGGIALVVEEGHILVEEVHVSG